MGKNSWTCTWIASNVSMQSSDLHHTHKDTYIYAYIIYIHIYVSLYMYIYHKDMYINIYYKHIETQ